MIIIGTSIIYVLVIIHEFTVAHAYSVYYFFDC